MPFCLALSASLQAAQEHKQTDEVRVAAWQTKHVNFNINNSINSFVERFLVG